MRVITEKRLLEIRDWHDKYGLRESMVIDHLINTEMQEIETLTVSKLRPMSEARERNEKRILVCCYDFPDYLFIVEKCGDIYWSDMEDDWYIDDNFIGYIPLPIYKPEK